MQAKDFELKEMKSDQIVRLHDFKGRPLLLTFWTSWCPDSYKDLLKKQALYEHVDDERLQIVMINVSGREREDSNPKEFIEKNGFTFPVLRDNGKSTYDAYQCKGVPSTFVINEEQEIIRSYGESSSFLEMMQGIEEVIGK